MLHSFKVRVHILNFDDLFYIFQKYDKYDIAAASLFLAAKVEENPRKVEHVLKTREEWSRNGPVELDTQSEEYQRKLNRLVDHEVSR